MSNDSLKPVLRPPQGWREEPLISVAESRFSGVDKLTYGSEEPIRLCNYTDVYKNDYITGDIDFMRASATQAEIDRFGLKTGDVIITKDSETPDDIGIPAVVDYAAPDLVCGYHLALLRPDQQQVDPTFIGKQLSHARIARYFGQQANGLTRYGLPIGAVENAPLWLPELNEQKAVGVILRLVDEAIAKTESVIAKLQQVRAGLLHDLLTRGLDADGQLRDPIAHPEQFQDSPFGQIPKEWDTCLLDDVAIRGSGHTPSKDVPSYWDGGIKWVSLADSDRLDRIYISETDKEISELGIENSSAVKHPAGTVILSRDAGIGKSAILAEEMAVSQHFMTWRCGKRLHNIYLYYWLQHNKRRFEAIAMGSTIKTIGLPYFKLLRIDVPLIEEQRTAANVILASEAAISAEEVELGKLHQLKSGLMTDLLTGRVRVEAN